MLTYKVTAENKQGERVYTFETQYITELYTFLTMLGVYNTEKAKQVVGAFNSAMEPIAFQTEDSEGNLIYIDDK